MTIQMPDFHAACVEWASFAVVPMECPRDASAKKLLAEIRPDQCFWWNGNCRSFSLPSWPCGFDSRHPLPCDESALATWDYVVIDEHSESVLGCVELKRWGLGRLW